MPTSLEDFTNKLKENMAPNPVTQPEVNKVKTVADFEAKLKQQVGNLASVSNKTNQKEIKIAKNLVVCFPSDFTGCGHIRCIYPTMFLNSIYGKSGKMICITAPFYIKQTEILQRARTMYFQRHMTQQAFGMLSNYKQLQKELKYKMVWDMDDMIWGKNELLGGSKKTGVPSYNFGYKNIGDEVREYSVKIMNLMDTCTFSTQYLVDFVKEKFDPQTELKVVPNCVPQFFWGDRVREDKTEPIKKLKVLYTGSPTHYSNFSKALGDFDNAWRKWVIESVNNETIDFICMGGLPWFFESIKDKITVYSWVDSMRYHNFAKNVKADIGIMPLVPNDFNHAKSDIKYIEYCALSLPAIGTVFTNGKPSPYDNCELTVKDNCTVDDINEVVDKLRQPKYYNNIKNKQFKMLSEKGRWMESVEYVKLVTSVL